MKAIDMNELAAVVNEIKEAGTSVDDAITATERRLKLLRTIRASLKTEDEPKPRTKGAVTA